MLTGYIGNDIRKPEKVPWIVSTRVMPCRMQGASQCMVLGRNYRLAGALDQLNQLILDRHGSSKWLDLTTGLG
jgi:hypothetical protein